MIKSEIKSTDAVSVGHFLSDNSSKSLCQGTTLLCWKKDNREMCCGYRLYQPCLDSSVLLFSSKIRTELLASYPFSGERMLKLLGTNKVITGIDPGGFDRFLHFFNETGNQSISISVSHLS